MKFLEMLNYEHGITIIMITHDMHLMLEYTHRAVVISDGEMIADQSAAEILTDPTIIKDASLKETSLYSLATSCGILDPTQFVERFIDYDREVRRL